MTLYISDFSIYFNLHKPLPEPDEDVPQLLGVVEGGSIVAVSLVSVRVLPHLRQHLRPAVLYQRQVRLQLYLLVILPNLSLEVKVKHPFNIPNSCCCLTWGAKFLL